MITPIKDNIVVKKKEAETNTTTSGIIYKSESDCEFIREVIAIGPDVPTDQIKVGDMVRVVSQTYKEQHDGCEIVKYEHILAVIT